nr:MAG TPA: hypothetical protein [Caudoviricetes sp.]
MCGRITALKYKSAAAQQKRWAAEIGCSPPRALALNG